MWLTRLKRFSDENTYYKQGGKFNVYQGDLKMPNCTTYFMLRQAEASELEEPKQIFKGRSATGFPNAKKCYEDSLLPKGTELREGCGIIFDGKDGHIAFCEKVLSPTKAIISQSQWTKDKSVRDYRYWETKEVTLEVGKATISGVGTLLGYIYPDINDKRVKLTDTTYFDKVEITEDYVNARVEPNGEVVSQGLYIPMGYYCILNTFNDDTYDWYQLDTNIWVREGSWTKVVKKDATDYKVKYEALLSDMKGLIKKYE